MKKFIITAIISSLIIPNAVFANESFNKELMDKAISNLNVNTQELNQEQMVKYHTDLNNEYVRLIKEREAQLEKERKEKSLSPSHYFVLFPSVKTHMTALVQLSRRLLLLLSIAATANAE